MSVWASVAPETPSPPRFARPLSHKWERGENLCIMGYEPDFA